MARNAMGKNLQQSIVKSLGRYLAIMAIIALGASIFVGLRMTKADMVATGQVYTRKQNMFDLRLISSYGWAAEQVEQAGQLPGIEAAEGQIYMDLIMQKQDSDAESVFRVYSIPEKVNVPVLVAGRMPENPWECLADGYRNKESALGTVIRVSDTNDEDSLERVVSREFTIVGLVSTPLYMDMNRGTTTVGNGSIENYLLLPQNAFDVGYYSEIQLVIPGEYDIYSKEYNDTLDTYTDKLEPEAQRLADERMQTLKAEAEEAYAEGLAEYNDGVRELWEGIEQAEQELRDAKMQLLEGEQELQDGYDQLVAAGMEIAKARKQLEEGWKQLEEGRKQLEASLAPIYEARDAAMKLIDAQEALIGDRDQQIANQLELVNQGLEAAEKALEAAEKALINETGLNAQQTRERILELQSQIEATRKLLEEANASENAEEAARLQAELEALEKELLNLEKAYEPYLKLLDGKNDLLAQKEKLENGELIFEITTEYIAQQRAMVEQAFQAAMKLFEESIAQLEAAEAQLLEAEAQLNAAEIELANAWRDWEAGKQELEEGWAEYEKGKAEAEAEIADGRQKLADGFTELMKGRREIDSMEEAEAFVLDRNTNLGYNSLDSASDIVQGVSKVFPAFFLLVAALVCITTMTRMVDEERTQIGTLKALGYSSWAIMSKYLLYSGSSALLGCGLGVLLGSVAFPLILWEAYKIMLYIPRALVITFDWGLCAMVVGMYTAAMLLVTWYCCYKTLQEVPAELIRPKAPAVGKRLIFEYLPFWKHISFLNKVTIRNIFRYRQRLAMMLVGVGGCTALLLTGFGLRDSIVNIVDFQFSEITTYDMQVYFSEGQTEKDQEEFATLVGYPAKELMFYHQISAELDANNQTRELYLIAAEEGVSSFIDFHSGSQALSYPGTGEVLLSVGVSEAMGIRVGDMVTLRNADMQTMNLKVSGIYDNHVENFAILSPETMAQQWGEEPEKQMAFIKCPDNIDVHMAAADIASMDGVMNVSVSEDLAFMVRNMMDALDLVVVVIVFCAALLAAIVLYNLTNININERLREIATIKVLGFKAGETAMYIFKENLTLSVMGAAAGLGMGKLLLDFVMSQIKIDMVWFQSRIMNPSYVWSVVLTILTAVIVDFIFYFRLEKINMAEALKSVE